MASYQNVFGADTIPPSGMGYRLIALTANVALSWADNYQGPDYITDINEVTASTSGWQINLPSALQQGTGVDFIMRNIGAYPFQVNDNKGVPVATVAAGEVKYFYLAGNSTDSGTWRTFTYGAGTSAADANLLKGAGLTVIGSALAQDYPITIVTANQAPAFGDRAKIYAFNGGAATVTLPSVLSVGNGYFIGVRNAGTGTITIQPTNPDLIDNVSNLTMQPGESTFIYCAGNTWFTVGYGRSISFQFTKLVKDISAGGALTLTSNEASNKMIQFSGTPASNVTLTIPSITNIYYVQCTYTGAASLTIKTAAASGITLSTNTTAILFCDGTNVISIAGVVTGGGGGGGSTNLFADGSAAAPSVTFSSEQTLGMYKAAAQQLGFATNGVQRLLLGNSLSSFATSLGIKTTNPVVELDVRGAANVNGNSQALAGGFTAQFQTGAANGTKTRNLIDAYGADPFLTLRSCNGTLAAPTATVSGNNLGSVSFAGRKSTTWSGETGFFIARATEAWSDTANGTQLLWAVTPNGSTTSAVKMILDQNGWLTVGTNTAPTQALTVNGNIITLGTGRIIGNVLAGSSSDGSYPIQAENVSVGSNQMIQLRYTASAGNTADTCYINSTNTNPFILQGIAPNYTVLFQTNTSGACTAPSFTNTSDERLKKDWADLPSDFLERLAGVKMGSFTKIDTGDRWVGVSAQSLLPVLPEAVMVYDEDKGYLSVAYGNAALVSVIELTKRVLALEAEVAKYAR